MKSTIAFTGRMALYFVASVAFLLGALMLVHEVSLLFNHASTAGIWFYGTPWSPNWGINFPFGQGYEIKGTPGFFDCNAEPGTC